MQQYAPLIMQYGVLMLYLYRPSNIASGLARIALSVILVLPQCISASEPDAGSFAVKEIAGGAYVHLGKHVEFEHPDHDDIANSGFIIGDRCVAVIDTGGSLRAGQALLSAIRAKTSLPVCYVINTHVHFDHVLGNIAFTAEGAEFVGHEMLADEIAANRAFFLENYGADLGDNPGESSIIGPTLLVSGSRKIDLGNRILTLVAHKVSHSHTDLSILDEKTRILWVSDLLFIERIPSIDGDLRNWVKLSKQLAARDVAMVVPGHGPVSSSPSSAFERQLRYLETLLTQTRAMIAKGMFMEDIVEDVGVKEKTNWLLHEQHHKRNVTRAFSELEWE